MYYALVLDIPTHLPTFGKTSAISSIMYIDVRDVGGGLIFYFLEKVSATEILRPVTNHVAESFMCCVCALEIIMNHLPYSESYFHIIFDLNI